MITYVDCVLKCNTVFLKRNNMKHSKLSILICLQVSEGKTAKKTSTIVRVTSAKTGPPVSTASTATRVSALRRTREGFASRTWTNAPCVHQFVKTAPPALTAWAATPAYALTGGQDRTAR